MKLSPEVLAEIIDIVREGLSEGKDISDRMRSLDLYANTERSLIELTPEWVKSNRRVLHG